MNRQIVRLVVMCLLVAAAVVVPRPVASQPRALSDLHTMVVGIGADEHVIAAGVPLTSGPWGTDFITVSHALRMGRQYSTTDPVTIRFLHANLLEWTKSKPGDWEQAWQNVMVADGLSKPGFSGSPWVRDGKVYGLLKGRVRPARQDKWYVVAETSTKVQECLKQLHYDDLIPTD